MNNESEYIFYLLSHGKTVLDNFTGDFLIDRNNFSLCVLLHERDYFSISTLFNDMLFNYMLRIAFILICM